MTAAELVAQVERVVGPAVLVRPPDAGLWGREIGDERYLVSVLR